MEPGELAPDRRERCGDARIAGPAISETELELLLILVNWDCLMAGVSSMMVPVVDWWRGFGVAIRCVFASVSSSDLSSNFAACGRKLTLLLADAAFRLARVGTGFLLPELDFLTWIGLAVTFLATMGLFRMPFCVWGVGGVVSPGVLESPGLLLPDLLTVTTAALPRSACTAGRALISA